MDTPLTTSLSTNDLGGEGEEGSLTPRVEVNVLIDKLAALQADEIAEYFKSEGIVGTAKASAECPIARYLKGYGWASSISQMYYQVWEESNLRVSLQRKEMPHSLAQFVERFDHHMYPELVEGEWPDPWECGCDLCVEQQARARGGCTCAGCASR